MKHWEKEFNITIDDYRYKPSPKNSKGSRKKKRKKSKERKISNRREVQQEFKNSVKPRDESFLYSKPDETKVTYEPAEQ